MSSQTLTAASSGKCCFQLAKRTLSRRQLRPSAVVDRDIDREKARRFRRPVFDAEQWKQHRSVKRYYAHIAGIFSSRIIRGLLCPMLYVAGISILVCAYHTLLDVGLLHQLVPIVPWPTVALASNGVFSITTFALSLLLVFRTNSSYERWWEARSCWTRVVSECIHLIQQTEHCLCPDQTANSSTGTTNSRYKEVLLRWIRAFPLTLKAHLREPDGRMQEQIAGVLEPHEVHLVLKSRNPPCTVLSMISQLVSASDVRIESKVHMLESVRALHQAAGNCQQILSTPLPLSYTRHTGRFLVLWLTCLPFVIWQELRWFSVPVSVIVSFLLFGIEEIGLQIEEPFGVMALDACCEEVSNAVLQAASDATIMRQYLQQLTCNHTGRLNGASAPQPIRALEIADADKAE